MRSLVFILAALLAYLLLRGLPEGLHPLMRTCLAVLLLVLGLGLWQKRPRHDHPRATSFRRPGFSDYIAIGMGVLAIECLFVFLLTVTPPRAEQLATSLEAWVHPESRRPKGVGGSDEARGDTGLGGNWLWDQHGRRRLPKRSSATPTNKPEAFLRPANVESAEALQDARPYLRAFALEGYHDASWGVGPLAAGSEDGWRQAENGRLTFPKAPARPGKPVEVRVFHPRHPTGQDVFLALQGVVETNVPRLREIAPGVLRLPPAESASGYEYRTTSYPLTFDQLVSGSRVPVIVPDPKAPPHLLELPGDSQLRDSFLQIAVKTQGTLDARLLALRRFLHRNCTYSLTVENPKNLNPLENFLFHERRGHCEYFASAGALLCRSLGIPARVAYGWAGGRYYPASNLYLFRAREAHAWTEILIEGVGWVIFDLTPADALEAATATTAPENETPPFDNPESPFDESSDEETAALQPWTLPLLVLGLSLGALTLVLLRLRARPEARSAPGSSTLLPDPPGYLTRFRRATAKLGHPMPTGRTLRQHLDTLRDFHLAPEFSQDLLDYHYGLTYGRAIQDRRKERTLAKAIKRWKG